MISFHTCNASVRVFRSHATRLENTVVCAPLELAYMAPGRRMLCQGKIQAQKYAQHSTRASVRTVLATRSHRRNNTTSSPQHAIIATTRHRHHSTPSSPQHAIVTTARHRRRNPPSSPQHAIVATTRYRPLLFRSSPFCLPLTMVTLDVINLDNGSYPTLMDRFCWTVLSVDEVELGPFQVVPAPFQAQLLT